MPDRQTSRAVVVHAPAKVNLFFEVLGKRADGYHDVETLMVPVGLFDTLLLTEDPSGQLELDCRKVAGPRTKNGAAASGSPAQDIGLANVPGGAANLAYRALELLRERADVRCGATLRLVKRIPATAGLGGGSSDAAAALVAANRVWGLGWSTAELAQVAEELGSDVPFFLAGGPAVCRGRGERVDPITGPTALHLVVVRPPAGLSTADVYRRVVPPGSPRPLAPVLQALRHGNLARLGRLLFNRLQPAAGELCSWIERLERVFQHQGCLGHLMSGSGSSCFALCRHQRHARGVARRLRAIGVGAVYAVRTSPRPPQS